MNKLTDRLHTWMAAGHFTRINDVEVWYRTFGNQRDAGPWLVCFHGFPTSSWDWHRLMPLLPPGFRVLVFDFPGYGLSAKPPGRDYSLLRQLDTVEGLLDYLKIRNFHLLAHDMGDSVACELLYRLEQGTCELDLHSVTLLNGGIYMELHQPLPTQRLLRTPLIGELTARLSSWRLFRHQYPQVYANPQQFDEEHYREQWTLLLHNQGRRTLAKIAGYMRERVKYHDRWLGPLHRLRLPLKVIWGKEDPIAIYAIAEKLAANNPTAELLILDGVGHYPQLEDPGPVARSLISTLGDT